MPVLAGPQIEAKPSQRANLQPDDLRRAGLGEKRVAAEMKRFVARIDERRHYHNRNLVGPARFAHMFEHGPAIDTRHREIEHDGVGREIGRFVDSAAAVARRKDSPAFHTQVIGIDSPCVHIVVHDEHGKR